MGEVRNSGRFNMASERTTDLEGITMTGDLTDLGKRDILLLVREVNCEIKVAREILIKRHCKSPYYYLKTKGLVYV